VKIDVESFIEKLEKISECVKFIDQRIVKVEVELVKNKYFGSVIKSENELEGFDQLLKARVVKNEVHDSKVNELIN
jgi:hypothetical protein